MRYTKSGKLKHFRRERRKSRKRLKTLSGDELLLKQLIHFMRFNEDLRGGRNEID